MEQAVPTDINQSNNEKWDLVIKPKRGWFEIDLKDLWRYRDLIFLFVKRNFVASYKQTILGPVWYLIQPIMSTVIFTIVFGRIAQIPTDGIPDILFYMSGIVCWTYFADCLSSTSDTFVANAGIFGKVYFPRLTVPVSSIITNLIKLSIQLLLFISFYGYFYFNGADIAPGLSLLFFPLLVLQMALLGLGFGIIVSSLTTKYRDLSVLVGFGVQLWMYATPVVYPISEIPKKYRMYYDFNPMAAIVTNFRSMMMGVGFIDWQATFLSVIITVVVLMIGILLFNRVEKDFMDTV